MLKDKIQRGDLFLVDSDKTGAKIVKFFMTAPTWYQHLWRKIRGTQEEVKFYHVGMFIDRNTIIEQQSKVIEKSSSKILSTGDRVCIIRKVGITAEEKDELIRIAREDLGEGYDVVNCIGKFLTWLTGITLFARYVEIPNQEICVCRGAYWYRRALEILFGAKRHSELTTHKVYKYTDANPDELKIVYEGVPANE